MLFKKAITGSLLPPIRVADLASEAVASIV